ncbi:MAG: flavin reductase family protein [Symbiobacteriia bacterium]
MTARHWPVPGLPGPIVLVTTVDAAGNVNVAPKSWIGMVTDKILVLGCTTQHHTGRNILATGECVLNLPADDLVEKIWAAEEFREPGPSEPEARGFTTLPSIEVAPPRIQECHTHLECRLDSVKWFDEDCAFFLKVVAASADAEAVARPDPVRYLRPIFFLNPGLYGTIEESRKVRP